MPRLRINYNAPFTLTFCFICAFAMLLAALTGGWAMMEIFSLDSAGSWQNPLTWLRLVTHIFGHANLEHLFFNLTFILLVGPLLEKHYGAGLMIFVSVLTAVVTGLIMMLFFNGLLLGASGVVFALIILSSFANAKSGTIPLTFILVTTIFVGNEILKALGPEDNIARFAHIAGGIIGGLAGFLATKSR